MKWKTPFSLYLTLINNLYLFILPLGILLMTTTNDYVETLTTFAFYLMLVPGIGGILMKTMYTSSNAVRISTGVDRLYVDEFRYATTIYCNGIDSFGISTASFWW
ncbi:MAG: hypothetical protein R3Y54_14070 [Eubacteriales bacterium]